MASDGKVTISTALDNKGFEKGIDNVSGSLGGLNSVVKKLGSAISVAFSVRVIASFAKECLDLGSDLQEVQNVVDVSFATMNENVNNFAKTASQTAGLSETMAKRYAGTFGAMAKSFKFTEDEAYEMATALTQLTGDVASFYNLTQDEAYTKLKSVFTGETESLKDLGVVMTQAALDNFALEKGLKKTTSEMTEQEKVALRYQFVLEQLSGASGDFVRTSDSWANQTRLLSLQLDQLKATIGQGLINALTPAIELLNTLISKLQEAADGFLAFTNVIFGDAGGSTGAVIEGVSDGLESAANSAGNLEENAREAKRALAGFDEINKLQADTDVSTDSVGASTGNTSSVISDIVNSNLGQMVDDSSEIEKSWTNTAKQLKDLYYEVLSKVTVRNFANFNTSLTNLASGWDNLLSTIGGADFNISDLIADAMDTTAISLAGQYKTLGGLLDLLAEFRRHYSETGSTDWLNAVFTDEDVWDALGEISSGWGMAQTAFLPESGAFGLTKEEWENLFLPITEEYTNLYRDLSTEAAAALSEYTEVHKKLSTELKKINWSDSVITEDTVAEVESLTNEVFSTITQNNAEARQAAEDSVMDLLDQGLISEEDARKAIKELEKTYKDQEYLVEKNQKEILSILKKAKDENRALTEEDKNQITELMNECNDKTVAVIKQGASDSQEIYTMLKENRGKMSKQMLSQAIQYANDEYAAKVKAAEDTYTASIANADKLYYDLGAIDAAEYERIKKEAADKKKVQIEEAEATKTALIKEAQAAAGGVADAVDPETGEILSNWEILWNNMFEKVNTTWENIKKTCKEFINEIIDFINTPANSVNSWFSEYGGKNVMGLKIPSFSIPTIPKLAQGAVIPPNKEFLAVLGDQRHGTNIEAPLETIQEAVALVMDDQTSAILTGFETSVSVQKEILEAVLGIQIGDDVIGQATARYNRKLAASRGGV